MNAEVLMDVLGSKTRREIIRFISQEPRYLAELSEKTGVEKMSVMRHLERMENAGILEHEGEKQKRGRPRKYYDIVTDLNLEVRVAHGDFKARFLKSKKRASSEEEFEEIKKTEDPEEKLKRYGSLAEHLAKDIHKHENAITKNEDLLNKVKEESLKLSQVYPEKADEKLLKQILEQ